MSRLPEPSPSDYCGGCDLDRPLYLLEGAAGDHVHRCLECLRSAVAGEQIYRLRQARDEARTWAREMWVTSGPPWLRNRPELGPAPDWADRTTGAGMTDPRPTEGHDLRTEPVNCLTASLYELAGASGDREQMLPHGLAALAELERRLRETEASLRVTEESVVRQKALLETATEMIEEARRWARSRWDDGPASEEPVVFNETEFAPAWLTADGPGTPHAASTRPGAPIRLRLRTRCGWRPLTDCSRTAKRSGVRSPLRRWTPLRNGSGIGQAHETDHTGSSRGNAWPARRRGLSAPAGPSRLTPSRQLKPVALG